MGDRSGSSSRIHTSENKRTHKRLVLVYRNSMKILESLPGVSIAAWEWLGCYSMLLLLDSLS
jgi:hypothetical protein